MTAGHRMVKPLSAIGVVWPPAGLGERALTGRIRAIWTAAAMREAGARAAPFAAKRRIAGKTGD